MSLTVPLAVRLSTSRGDRHVTRELRDLTFRSVIPGGFASIVAPLDRPLSLQPDEIAYYGRAVVYDTRNGGTVCEGRLEDPGRGAGADGQVWELVATGPSAHASDRTVPLLYADRNLGNWRPSRFVTTEQAGISQAEDGGGNAGWRIHIPRGTSITTSDIADVYHRLLADTDQSLARLSVTWDAGMTDSDWVVSIRSSSTGTATSTLQQAGASTAGGTLSASRGGSPAISSGQLYAYLRLHRQNTSTTPASDDIWVHFTNVVLRGLLKDKAGSDITSGYSADTVLASEVVADLLGRLLTEYDGANASIATTSHAIDQLAYPDGVTARQVLDDLLKLESGYYWAAWEQGSTGRHRFEFRAWPTTPRYEADADDGYDSAGSSDGLYDAVRVRFHEFFRGQIRTVRRTQTIPELAAAGITREGFLDLGDELGSETNANRAGDQFLIQHRYAPNAGRLTIIRPILDTVAGRMVMPWEIRPGHLIRVRGILPRVDALNPTDRDGVTIFRVTAVTYKASAASAELELDSTPLTLPRQLARLSTRVPRRR